MPHCPADADPPAPSPAPPAARLHLLERAILAAAILAALLPIALSTVPPLADYPGHLARIHILHDLLTEGVFAPWYRLQLALVPNLGADAAVLALRLLGLPTETAGRLFVALLVLLLGVGVLRLHRTLFGRPSIVPVLAFAVIYTRCFMWGFLSYLLGLGLLLLAFDTWLRLRRRPTLAPSAAWLAAAAALLFLVHLMPSFLLAGLALSYEVGTIAWAAWQRRPIPPRRAATRIAACLPAVTVLLLLFAATPQATGSNPVPHHILATILAEIPSRLWRLAHVLDAYAPLADPLTTLLLAATLAGALATRRLRLAPAMLPGILGLTALFLVVPEEWAGTAMIAERLPFAILLLALASIDIRPAGLPWRAALAGLVLALVLIRGQAAATAWARAGRAYAPILAAFDTMPEGASIYGIMNVDGSTWSELRLPWRRFATMAVIRRNAFSPDVFADPTQNLVVIRQPCAGPPFASLGNNAVHGAPEPEPQSDMLRPDLLARFGYLLAQRPDLYQHPLPPRLTPIAESGGTVLFRIQPAADGTDHAALPRCPPPAGRARAPTAATPAAP